MSHCFTSVPSPTYFRCFVALLPIHQSSAVSLRLCAGCYSTRCSQLHCCCCCCCCVSGGTSTPPKLSVQATATTLSIQHQGFAPVLNRCWSLPVDSSQGVTSWSSSDGQLMCMVVPKAQPGRTWNTCFTVCGMFSNQCVGPCDDTMQNITIQQIYNCTRYNQ